jgi:hypothetical protein
VAVSDWSSPATGGSSVGSWVRAAGAAYCSPSVRRSGPGSRTAVRGPCGRSAHGLGRRASRVAGRSALGLYTLGFDWEANDFFYFIADVARTDGRPADHVRHRRGAAARGVDARPPSGYEGAAARAHRQRRLPTSASTTCWGRLLDSIYLHTKTRDQMPEQVWPIIVHQVECRDGALALARPRASGRCAGIPSTSPPPRSCAGWPWTAARAWPGLRGDDGEGAHLADRGRRGPRDVLANGPDERGVFTQHYDTDALDASCLLMPLLRFLPARTSRVVATVHAIADELTVGRARAALPHGRDRRRPAGRGGHVRDLLVLARERARGDRGDAGGRGSCARSCSATRRRSSSTRRRSTRVRAGTSATSRRPSRTSRSSTPSCTSSAPTRRWPRRTTA